MLKHTDLRPKVRIVLDDEPYEVIESVHIFKGRGQSIVQLKLKNLITGKLITKTAHAGEDFEEAEITKDKVKLLYSKGDKLYFCLEKDPSRRFEFKKNILGIKSKFLKQNNIYEGLFFREKLINLEVPLRVQFKVVSAPPGIRTGRETPGTKQITLDNGVDIQAPLFIKEGDIIEVNTETGEYVRRI